jgi:hypothetical protein
MYFVQVVVSGGDGYINVFKQHQKMFERISNIPTRNGARTSLLIPQLKLFILAERTSDGKGQIFWFINYPGDKWITRERP